jgi:hypothetical protein
LGEGPIAPLNLNFKTRRIFELHFMLYIVFGPGGRPENASILTDGEYEEKVWFGMACRPIGNIWRKLVSHTHIYRVPLTLLCIHMIDPHQGCTISKGGVYVTHPLYRTEPANPMSSGGGQIICHVGKGNILIFYYLQLPSDEDMLIRDTSPEPEFLNF